jgi:hypothetical protein
MVRSKRGSTVVGSTEPDWLRTRYREVVAPEHRGQGRTHLGGFPTVTGRRDADSAHRAGPSSNPTSPTPNWCDRGNRLAQQGVKATSPGGRAKLLREGREMTCATS